MNKSQYNSRIEWKKACPKDYKQALRDGYLEQICEYFGWDYLIKRNNYPIFNYNYSKLSNFFHILKKYGNSVIKMDTNPSYPFNNDYVTFVFKFSDKTNDEILIIGDELIIDFKVGGVFQYLSSGFVISEYKTLQISFYKKCPKYGENDNHLTYSNLAHLYDKFMGNFINLVKKDLEISF